MQNINTKWAPSIKFGLVWKSARKNVPLLILNTHYWSSQELMLIVESILSVPLILNLEHNWNYL